MTKKIIRLLGVILILIGVYTPIYYKLKEHSITKLHVAKVTNKLVKKEEYFAVIEIPKINLKRELYPVNDVKNNVNKNIFVHKNSIFPNNIILAAHSGNGKNAYFKNIYKLKIGNTINIYYNNKLYTYEIKDIEYQNKTGTLYLKNEYNITLITCTYHNSKTQTIYYGILKNSQNIP